MIKRAVITNPSSDVDQFGVSQNSYFGKTGKAQDVYPYGIHAVPPEGTLTLLFNVNAQEDNQAQIPLCDQFRTKGKKPGEVEGGNFLVGSVYIFKENGDWNIDIKGDVNLNVDGDVNITTKGDANVTAQGDVNVNAQGNANVTATNINLEGSVNLGSGGAAIARVGDAVSGGNTIIGGSSNHTAT